MKQLANIRWIISAVIAIVIGTASFLFWLDSRYATKSEHLIANYTLTLTVQKMQRNSQQSQLDSLLDVKKALEGANVKEDVIRDLDKNIADARWALQDLNVDIEKTVEEVKRLKGT